MSLLDRLDVPEARSRASTRATDSPREAASSGRAGAGDAAADDQDVEALAAQPGQVAARRLGDRRAAAKREIDGSRTQSTR